MSLDKRQLAAALGGRAPLRLTEGRRAAVLVPIFFAPEGARVLFMKRPDDASAHAGQVSFPGGRAEDSDPDHVATALREANEELGIEPALVDVIGTLDDINTAVSDYNITPVVGVLRTEPAITPSPVEVAAHFWVPFTQLARLEAWRGMDVVRRGKQYHVWFYDHAPHVIWGATAAITRQLVELWANTH